MALNSLLSLVTHLCFVAICLLHVKTEALSLSQESCYTVNAKECYGAGTYNCGVCECYDGHFGRFCECLASNVDESMVNKCIPPGATNDLQCSGRGVCSCNQCQCDARPNPNEIITGSWCECDNFSCDRVEGKICSDHGKCDCGQCICESNWMGIACECYVGKDTTCYLPVGNASDHLQTSNSKPCDGHGTCVCGACECEITEEGRFSGRYCEQFSSIQEIQLNDEQTETGAGYN